MSPRSVVVVHRQHMLAEAIAAALVGYPGLAPVAIAASESEGEQFAQRADAVVLDRQLPGSTELAARLRRQGVRVVLLGEETAAEDGLCVSPQAPLTRLAQALVPGSVRRSAASKLLTPRERQVLALVSRGLSAKQVAQQMGISPKTVEQHKSRIFTKLGVANQTAAVTLALANGFPRSEAWKRSNT
jgi:DNA-binding NarL/FixJ family response regulator